MLKLHSVHATIFETLLYFLLSIIELSFELITAQCGVDWGDLQLILKVAERVAKPGLPGGREIRTRNDKWCQLHVLCPRERMALQDPI